MEYQYKDRGLATDKGSVTPPRAVSDYVWQRDGGICIYCGNPAQVLDHVIRWADNGLGISSNLVCSCNKCNIYKGKHPRGLKQLTRAIFWLMTHDEDVSWMDNFYPDIEANLKRPRVYALDRERQTSPRIKQRTEAMADIIDGFEFSGVDKLERVKLPPLKQKWEGEYVPDKVKKSSKSSTRTKVVAYRLENDVYSIVERRAGKRKVKVSEYLKNFISRDARRRR